MQRTMSIAKQKEKATEDARWVKDLQLFKRQSTGQKVRQEETIKNHDISNANLFMVLTEACKTHDDITEMHDKLRELM